MHNTEIGDWNYFRINILPKIKKVVLHDIEYTDKNDIQSMSLEAYLQKETIKMEMGGSYGEIKFV
ncbi:hypothetical protein [Psychrilyobacter atlanticus]|uniref:hypothetical protein n=1 Tax=Psychrilyobacter atlanticus TaxID=271091 RepID=UPI00048B18D0|nr:hypothetical protein [Psychrilyobacter atlanticus]